MSKHTPEPWQLSVALSGSENDRGFDINANGKHIARVSPMIKNSRGDASEEGKANAQRAVACVNACAGLNPEGVPDAVAALRGLLREIDYCVDDGTFLRDDVDRNAGVVAARAALAKLEATR